MSTQTLDNMTVEQLRDLAQRAEAAAKKAKARDSYIMGLYGQRNTDDPYRWFNSFSKTIR